nr:hypothetical protein [uncultured Desulfobulbus sp.]
MNSNKITIVAAVIGMLFLHLMIIPGLGNSKTHEEHYTVDFKSDSLSGALHQIESQTKSQIKLKGDIRLQNPVFMRLEGESLSSILDYTLKRFRVENNIIIYSNNNKNVEITTFPSVDSESNDEYLSGNDEYSHLSALPLKERVFTSEDFGKLEETSEVVEDKVFSDKDFEIAYRKQGESSDAKTIFSADDYWQAVSFKSKVKVFPEFDQEIYTRVQATGKVKATHIFSNKDFRRLTSLQ